MTNEFATGGSNVMAGSRGQRAPSRVGSLFHDADRPLSTPSVINKSITAPTSYIAFTLLHPPPPHPPPPPALETGLRADRVSC